MHAPMAAEAVQRLPAGNLDLAPDVSAFEASARDTAGQSRLALALKRGFDLAGSLLLVVVFAPVWIAIAIAIKLDSHGPVLYRQRRVGRDGEYFQMLKFRTMVDGAHDRREELRHLNDCEDGLFKVPKDPRVTRVGALLRATSLDELPQLAHVLTGKMSLVGPRPLVPEEDILISGHFRRRLELRPGMTGPWQVAGASRVPIREMVRLDCDYVAGRSMVVDVKLLLGTVQHVVRRRGR